jgi:hypothetical protein
MRVSADWMKYGRHGVGGNSKGRVNWPVGDKKCKRHFRPPLAAPPARGGSTPP